MLEKRLRDRYQKTFVNSFAAFISNYVSGGAITLIALIFGIAVPFLLYGHYFTAAVILLLLSGYCDTLDGAVARLRNESSSAGAALDIVTDRIVEFSVIFGIYLLAPETRGLYCIMMLGSNLLCITSFLVVGIFKVNESYKGFHYSEGLIERAEAFLFYIAMIIAPFWFEPLAIIYNILVVYSAILHILRFLVFEKVIKANELSSLKEEMM